MDQAQTDFDVLRREMVEGQLRGRGIEDERVLDAMGQIPRHAFVDMAHQSKAYDDCPLPIACGQTISQPYMVAVMTELLEVGPESSVLEIGTGSGYQAAVLGRVSKRVITIERHDELVEFARANMRATSVSNVRVRAADGTLGAPDEAPFDAILVAAGGPKVPRSLINQLAVNGRMVCPVGNRKKQRLIVVHRTVDGVEYTKNTRCRFVPLIGEQGWSQ